MEVATASGDRLPGIGDPSPLLIPRPPRDTLCDDQARLLMRLSYPMSGRTKKTGAILVVLLGALALLFLARHWGFWLGGSPTESQPTYAGSASCRECHESFYRKWATSRHGLAMQPYTPRFAQAELEVISSGEFVIGDRRYRAAVGPSDGFVLESGPEGEKKHSIAQVLGGKNVYYFLTPSLRGRLQVLPLAYDVRRREWFDTAASALRRHAGVEDAPLRWTHRAFSFNTSCYSCHVSQISKNYDLETDTYQTRWLEPGINCETCHGPAGVHLREANSASYPKSANRDDIVRAGSLTADQKNTLCGSCHAKMIPISAGYRPGGDFWDHFDLVTLESLDYFPDGRDLGENYTFTSWSLSPCVRSGRLDCLHCHTSSGRLRFTEGDPNQVCLPCHQDIVRKSSEHSRHRRGSEADRCISCHMPKTEFARMRRTDHSMLAPAPAASRSFGSPNACDLCHQDRSSDWSDNWVRRWYRRDYQAEVVRRGHLVEVARKRDWRRLSDILRYISSSDSEPVFVTSLVRLLEACGDQRKWRAFREASKSPSPLVRGAVAEALGHGLTDNEGADENLAPLLGLVRDTSRLVRIRAAAALSAMPRSGLETSLVQALEAATEEYLVALRAQPDHPESYTALGNYYLNRGVVDQAVAEFETALRIDPENVPALVNAALASNLAGRNEKAELFLREALRLDPRNEATLFNLGLLLGETGRARDAEMVLRDCLKVNPQHAPAAYNLSVLLSGDRLREALKWCRLAASLQPAEPRYLYTVAFYTMRSGEVLKAHAELRRLLRSHPAYAEAYSLLGEGLEGQGKRTEAAELYREALAQTEIPESEREAFRDKLRRLESKR